MDWLAALMFAAEAEKVTEELISNSFVVCISESLLWVLASAD